MTDFFLLDSLQVILHHPLDLDDVLRDFLYKCLKILLNLGRLLCQRYLQSEGPVEESCSPIYCGKNYLDI